MVFKGNNQKKHPKFWTNTKGDPLHTKRAPSLAPGRRAAGIPPAQQGAPGCLSWAYGTGQTRDGPRRFPLKGLPSKSGQEFSSGSSFFERGTLQKSRGSTSRKVSFHRSHPNFRQLRAFRSPAPSTYQHHLIISLSEHHRKVVFLGSFRLDHESKPSLSVR